MNEHEPPSTHQTDSEVAQYLMENTQHAIYFKKKTTGENFISRKHCLFRSSIYS